MAIPGRGSSNTIVNILHYFTIVNLDTHIGKISRGVQYLEYSKYMLLIFYYICYLYFYIYFNYILYYILRRYVSIFLIL